MADSFHTHAEVEGGVRRVLLEMNMRGSQPCAIRLDSLLVEDLGLDSVHFVDLTIMLEDSLGIAEFPMQAWVDDSLSANLPLSVGRLIEACTSALRGPSLGVAL